MKRTGAQILWETLLREGVEVVFGYPGGANLPIYDAMPNYPIRHILARHEQGATHMADGYARASGRVGVVLVTSGPGATNTVTGIATAMMDSSPIVVITGQVPSKLIGYDAFQEVDMTGITLPITKHNYLVTDVNELGRVLREAFYIASSGRPGPVLIDIAKDAQQAATEWEPDTQPIILQGYRPEKRVNEDEIIRVSEMIHAAKRPVILAGAGILRSNAVEELRQLAEIAQIPVGVTLMGIGSFPANHDLHLGYMGMHGEAWVNKAIQQSDLILALGMRFSDRVTGNIKNFAKNAQKIHIDIDNTELNKNVKVDLALNGDLKNTLKRILPYLKRMDHSSWLEEIDEIARDSRRRDIQNKNNVNELLAAHVIYDLWKYTQGESLICTDVGQHQMWTAQYYKFNKPYRFITSGGLGTMGFGLPAAIGAKVARPNDEVWVIAGDGGFQMTQAELATLRQENIKMNIAVINNGYLGMVRQWQEFFYEKRYAGTPIISPDFVKIAEAHGHQGIRVTQRSEVESAIQRARTESGTILLDFRVRPEDSVYPMVPSGANLDEMIRRPEEEIIS